MDNPMSKQSNPFQGTVSETYKTDGSKQANIKGQGGSMQINQGADGNMTMTKTEDVDFSQVMPFTSLQPAATAMDQIFGTKMAGAMPSQSQLIGQYRNLQGQEADPMDELRKIELMKKIESYGKPNEHQVWSRGMREKEFDQKQKLQASQAAEKEARTRQIQDKKVTDYAQWLQKSGIPEVTETLKEIERIATAEKDLPGYGQTGSLPDFMISQEGEDLRSSVGNLFNVTLKDRSGAAVTDTELTRLKQEFESGLWKSDEALRRGLTKYKDRLQAVIRNINTGTAPDVVEEYQKRPAGRDFLSDVGSVGFDFGKKKTSNGWDEKRESRYQQLSKKYGSQ